MKRALITGIAGQDGSYLAELLLAKGYTVHGTVRNTQSLDRPILANLENVYASDPDRLRFHLHYLDLSDTSSFARLIREVKPDEVYNLAAQSHVQWSFQMADYTAQVTGFAALNLLTALREERPDARFYQASSSEMFGKVTEVPQKETTPMHPRSPYACAKVYAYWTTVNFREAYGMHASNGILFNHESPRRGEHFVTRKITRALARIVAKRQSKLKLGNLDALRDWGHARDYVRAMWMMLQAPTPGDYVIATGEMHSVREFLQLAFGMVDLKWEDFVEIDPTLFRPAEVDELQGDYSRARNELGWQPECSFEDLVREMVEADLTREGLEAAQWMTKKTPSRLSNPKKFRLVKPDAPRLPAEASIYVAGHQGLVGSTLIRTLKARGYKNIVTRTRAELDLTSQRAVDDFFAKERPDYVVMAAARVGGILANSTHPADFLFDNLSISTHVLRAAAETGVKKLLYLGSSCIYPRLARQPIRESALMTGPLESTNEGYAVAKIAGVKYCEMLFRQYGKEFVSVMPTNLYGPGDNFHPTHSHVVPGLMRRFHEAKVQGLKTVSVWGTGRVRRELLYAEDLAEALCVVLERVSGNDLLNIGAGEDLSVSDLARLVAEATGFQGEILFDASKPNGTPRKLLDSSKVRALGWTPRVSLPEGLRRTYEWALQSGALEAGEGWKKVKG